MKTDKASDDGALLRIPFNKFAVVTVCLPSISLLFCFLVGILFQFFDVNETVCNVTNFIPSISAVTGITPQRYVWRICIALHCTPRFAVAFMYYNLYNGYLQNIPKQHHRLFVVLTKVNFWLNIIENSSLIGVTYISNKENYPIHEKIFIVFMVASLCYMLLNTVIFKWTRDKITEEDEKSLKWKVVMFISILVATAGLLFFFVRHRFFCEPLAFSWFSLCEYVIAYTNMGYHVTAAYDFKNVTFYAVSRLAYTSPPATSINGVLVNNNKKQR